MVRKGPEAIPYSWMLFHVTVILWLLPLLVSAILIPNFTAAAVSITLASWILSLVLFAIIVHLSGYRARLLQTLSAIIGCGALIFQAQVAGIVLLTPFLGASLVQIFVWLLLFWSVRVKGHIIACAIQGERHVGMLIAIAVFVLQYALATAFTPRI